MIAKAVGGLVAVIFVIIALIVITTTTWQVPELQNYTDYEPYSFNAAFVRENQAKRFLWFYEYTQERYKITNTDTNEGTFSLNCIFDDGKTTKATTNKVKIASGESAIVTVNSPLNGHSSITSATVAPPTKPIQKTRTIMVNHSTLDYVGLGWLLKLFK